MKVQVQSFPQIPERIYRVADLAYNLWWSWNADARELFRRLDRMLWRITQHNPVSMLQQMDPAELERASRDRYFLDLYDSLIARYDEYMTSARTWYSESHPNSDSLVAYFCAEFGLHNSLPIYSGGLGLLAGDTCKEASDLGLPMVAIGSLYPEGYFHQRVDANGRQEAIYSRLNTDSAPLLPVLNEDGSRLLVRVPLGNMEVRVAVWRVQVGRVPIYLMDTDIDENEVWLRDLSARLYGGDQQVRLRQEIILGMGGVRVLRALGYRPTVLHLNEGHAAFAGIELLREYMVAGAGFEEALERLRRMLVFTTHTPVKAGHDEFPFHQIEEYFAPTWESMGIGREQLLSLGQSQGKPSFSMTVLALRTARKANAVSKRHGEVSREMWKELWPELEVKNVPIISITNGVHVPTWIAPEFLEPFERHLGPYWLLFHDDLALWEKILQMPDRDIWEIHIHLKGRLMAFIREEARRKWIRDHVSSSHHLVALGTLLDRDALTIGFARRFATYKRATLVFRDMERLKKILLNPWRPVQIIFSGKAHPADEPGKFFLQQVFQACASHEMAGHIAFVEDYDKHVAHYLKSGVDVWLNNPTPPMEASGTSGQKASLNGIINCSVRDGWWYEGYNGNNGWAIEGDDDDAAAASLYDLLEKEIVPLYFERDAQNIPRRWAQMMKEAIRSTAARYSARRMVKEYTHLMYDAAPIPKGPKELLKSQ